MKIKLLICLLVFLFAMPLTAAPPKGKMSDQSLKIDNSTFIDANRILMFVTNHGNFGRDLAGVFGNDYGTFFPYAGDPALIASADADAIRSPNYASGLWIGGVDQATGETRVIIAEYSDEYVPGPMENGTFIEDNPRFKVYKLYGDSLASNPNQDYLDYLSYAIDQGAPWDTNAAGEVIPDMVGDQMLWAVFNDANPAQHTNDAGLTAPLGIEVKQTTFAFNRQGSLGNIVVFRMRVSNKGSNTLEDCYLSIWCDPDLGGAGDDLVGCDTTLGLGYVYNAAGGDQQYGDFVPSMGYDFFQGPLRARTPADTFPDGTPFPDGRMWDTTYADSVNIGMTSFNKYINGTDPNDFGETYNYMRGLTNDGQDYIYDGHVLKFVHTGNPVTGEGDIDIAPADRRWMQSTGPITFAPGDSTEIIAAMVIGQALSGDSPWLQSIDVMKGLDAFAQRLYESGFNPPKPPAKPKVNSVELPGKIVLTWDDTSEVDPGDYRFEGYTVWQGESPAGPWSELATYDVINDREFALFDTLIDPYTGLALPVVMRALSNSGLKYTYMATTDVFTGNPLRDATDYFFRVTAFSHDYIFDGEPVPNGDRFLESETKLTLTPEAPIAGKHITTNTSDTLASTHVSGNSDGAVYPMVMDPFMEFAYDYTVNFGTDTSVTTTVDTSYLDPDIGPDTCDAYWDDSVLVIVLCEHPNIDEITTSIDTTYTTYWNMYRTDGTTVDTLEEMNFNLSGDDDYQIYDGLLIKVTGPPLAGKDWDYVSADPANLSPVATAADPEYTGGRWITGGNHGGDIFFGGVFLAPNFWGMSNIAPDEFPPIEIHFRPMESFTDLNGDGVYTIGEPYVVDEPDSTQGCFMYQAYFDGSSYEGFYPVPFTAWDVSDPANPRQLNAALRDRDGNHQWDLNFLADTEANPDDTLLPNGGDLQYNYLTIMNSDYDPTGTYYGDGTGGTINPYAWPDSGTVNGEAGLRDALWTLWVNDRDNGGMLAEEATMTFIPNYVITPADTFTFSSAAPPTYTSTESDLDAIKAVPNPFYLYSNYDPSPGVKKLKFHHLPEKCTITIYNIAGDRIKRIDKTDLGNPIAEWDLLTDNGLPVASGMYIYVVEAPGFGTKIGKVAIFTEAEVLDLY